MKGNINTYFLALQAVVRKTKRSTRATLYDKCVILTKNQETEQKLHSLIPFNLKRVTVSQEALFKHAKMILRK